MYYRDLPSLHVGIDTPMVRYKNDIVVNVVVTGGRIVDSQIDEVLQ